MTAAAGIKMPLNQSFALAFGHKNKVSKGEEKQTSNVI